MSREQEPGDALVPAPRAVPVTARPRFVWPRPIRVALMVTLFAGFFAGSPVLALVVFPLMRLFSSKEKFRERCTYLLYRGMRFVRDTARFVGIVGLDLPPMPPSVDRSKPYVLVSNHPTFIDMIVLLGTFGELTCVTNGRWWKHWALGALLRSTVYLPGPGSGLPGSDDMLASMVTTLRGGRPLLIFPEGQRSTKDKLRRFRRGAVQAAIAADVPLVPLFLVIDRPYLTKNVSIWSAPKQPPMYQFDWFEVMHPADFDHDPKRMQAHIETMYTARFEEQKRRYAALTD